MSTRSRQPAITDEGTLPALTGATGNTPFDLVARLQTSEAPGVDRAEQVEQQLETAIAVGLIGSGDRLPPERELAAQLGVSTLTLRAALASLRERGFIRTTRGRGGGSAVCDADVVSERRRRRLLREQSTEQLRDLGDLAASIASASARLAAARSDDADKARLQSLADSFRSAVTQDERRRADSRFHIGVAVAAQSHRLTTAALQVQGEIAPLLWAPDPDGQVLDFGTAARDHAAILAAIADDDENGAHVAALQHCVRESEALIEAHLDLIMAETGV